MLKTNLFTRLLLSLLLIPLFLPFTTPKAEAHAIEGEPPGFTPSFLISDADFTTSDTMDAAAINSFFASKGSWLTNYVLPEYINVPYFCKNSSGNNEIRYTNNVRQIHVNGTTPLYGMTAAELIAERSRANGLNPQVLLVLLQRESSAITRDAPSSDTTRAWPLFYGFNDTMKNFGYSCDSGTAEAIARDYGGIGQQIAYAPFSLKNRYSQANDYNTSSCSWAQPVTDNGACFTPANRATRALYVYTPAVHTGNHNFWYYFISWFGVSSCPARSAVSVIKGSGAAIYALRDGVRHYVPSLNTLYAWGLDCVSVTTVSDGTLNGYPQGEPLTRVVKEAGGPRVFILENGLLRHIRTSLYVEQMGLQGEAVPELPIGLIESFPQGAPLGFLVKSIGGTDIYLAQSNYKILVPNVETVAAWGFPLSELIQIQSSYLNRLPTYGTLSVLVKGPGPEIYAASERSFHYIPSLERVRDWKLENYSITTIDGSFLKSLPQGDRLSQVTRGSGNAIYYVKGGQRYHLSTLNAAQSYNAQYGPLVIMSDTLIGRIPQVGTLR